MSLSSESVLHSYLKPNINILHLEDDRANTIFIHSVLGNIPGNKFTIFTVTSLAAAAKEITRQAPDLILLDLTVDDSSGLETLDRMRALAPLIPIVITTADDSQSVIQTAIHRGAQDFLFKHNINPDLLNRTICNAIDRKIAENAMHEKNLILETMIDSEVVGYWDWYINENRRVLSSEVKSMLGFRENELSDHWQVLQGLIYPADVEMIAESFRQHVRSKGEIPYRYTARFQHENGSYRCLACRGKVIAWSSDYLPIRMVGCFIDMTALESEQGMELLNQTESERQTTG